MDTPAPGEPLTGRLLRAARYTRRQRRFRARAEGLGPRARRLSVLAGLTFVPTAIALLAVLLGEAPPAALVGVLGLLVVVAALFARHAQVQKAEAEAWRWCKVNESAERRCRDTWRELADDGADLVDADHPHSSDLDVFGAGSLFQLINVAHTSHGRRALAQFLSGRAELHEIRARQAAVRCLAPNLSFGSGWRR